MDSIKEIDTKLKLLKKEYPKLSIVMDINSYNGGAEG